MFMKATRLILLVASITAIIYGCDNAKHDECVTRPELTNENVELDIVEYHNQVLDVDSPSELNAFLKENPTMAEFFFKRSQYPSDSILVHEHFRKFQNPHIDSLQMDINRTFGDLSDLKAQLTEAFSHIKHYYPETTLPKIKTVATGLNQDLYVSDSLIIIGLDYYLGPDSKYRPINAYNYILQRYAPEYIVPSIMLLYGISPRYNSTDISDKTILADMVAYGKSFYFAKHMMPCTPDSVIIWYNAEEMNGVRENADVVWSHFVQNQILFETSHEVKRKYIEERPKTYDIGEKAPGRIGTWLGWEIVRAYMRKNPDLKLSELMMQRDSKKIFKESKYKP